MTTAFQESPLPDVVPIRSGLMADRLADANVPLLGGSAPSTRRSGAARRSTFVPPPPPDAPPPLPAPPPPPPGPPAPPRRSTFVPPLSERMLVPVATACLATGGVALAVGVTMLL